MNFNSLRYCLRQSREALKRNFWLALVTSCIIAVSLIILGGFLLLAVNVAQVMRDVQSNVEICVFLYDDADQDWLAGELQRLEGVETIRFVSKEEGLAEFGRSLGDAALLAGLQGENNPLPDAFRVTVTDAELVPALAQTMRELEGVEMAEYGEEFVGELLKITGWINRFLVVVGLLLALGAVFLIVTTIRLSLMARREEIGIMKYLGASDWFVRFPFLLEGLAMGWLGNIVAVFVLAVVYGKVASTLQQDAFAFFLRPVTSPEQLLPVFLGLLLLGTCMGGFGSLISLHKFLRV
ncbi:MAG: ABC transporter permease [Firmicutes bacterium]|mgnify:FL=1|nr:ABC transporter permease [Bacillota bacterium]